jgi:hypothetical protein
LVPFRDNFPSSSAIVIYFAPRFTNTGIKHVTNPPLQSASFHRKTGPDNGQPACSPEWMPGMSDPVTAQPIGEAIQMDVPFLLPLGDAI